MVVKTRKNTKKTNPKTNNSSRYRKHKNKYNVSSKIDSIKGGTKYLSNTDASNALTKFFNSCTKYKKEIMLEKFDIYVALMFIMQNLYVFELNDKDIIMCVELINFIIRIRGTYIFSFRNRYYYLFKKLVVDENIVFNNDTIYDLPITPIETILEKDKYKHLFSSKGLNLIIKIYNEYKSISVDNILQIFHSKNELNIAQRKSSQRKSSQRHSRSSKQVSSKRKSISEEDKSPMDIKHIWYRNWPDHGVPEDTAIIDQFMYDINKQIMNNYQKQKYVNNIVVHCSAGIGRTGTVIAILRLMFKKAFDKIEITSNLIAETIRNDRQFRPYMVQADREKVPLQFKFICDFFAAKPNEDDYNQIPDIGDNKTLFSNELCIGKDRYSNISPYNDDTRVKLTGKDKTGKARNSDDCSDYINASHMEPIVFNVEGQKITINLIAAQCPTENTKEDFLTMLRQQEIDLIVMVTNLNEKKIDKQGKIKVMKKCNDYTNDNYLKTLEEKEDKSLNTIYGNITTFTLNKDDKLTVNNDDELTTNRTEFVLNQSSKY